MELQRSGLCEAQSLAAPGGVNFGGNKLGFCSIEVPSTAAAEKLRNSWWRVVASSPCETVPWLMTDQADDNC